MNNISKIILIFSIAILGASALGVSVAQADSDNLVVEFQYMPLFGNEDNEDDKNFMPGNSVLRWVKVTNDSGELKDIAVETINYIGFPNPADVPEFDLSRALSIVISIRNEDGTNGDNLYGGTTGAKTLYDLFQEGETLLTEDLSGDGGQITYNFEIGFSIEKANEWQAATTNFDILIGFQGQEQEGDTPPPSPTPPGGSSGSGGTAVPGLTISREPTVDISASDNSVTIEWLTSYYSTSQVVYSVAGEPPTPEESHTFKFNEPYYGYAHGYPDPVDSEDEPEYTEYFDKKTSHKITISGLLSGRTYYYRVVSHASPPTISREYTFTVPEVKGASTETGGGEQPTGGQDTQGQEDGGQEAGIGEKLVQGITSILGLEEKETLSLEDLDNLGLLDSEEVGVLLDDIEEKDLPLNLTANLSSIFDKFEGSTFLWIFIILLFLILILIIAKFLKDRKKKENN